MPIQTTNAKVITDSELARANALEIQAAALTVTAAEQAAEIARLRALLAPPPPPPPPPVTNRTGLYVDGSTLRTKRGTAVQLRGIELMYGTDAFNLGPFATIALCKALGANCVGVLFQGANGSVERVKALCDAARAAGLVIGVNADHQDAGRNWLNAPAMVTLLNGYDNVFLCSEVETDLPDSGLTVDQWVTGASGLVNAVVAAGHVNPIKVGAPQGGRRVEFPLAGGQRVVNAHPQKNVLLTFQAYWPASTANSWYQSQASVPAGVAGTKQALQRCAASGLCFVPGFDWVDDVGLTDELALIDEAHRLGLSYQHWALTRDGNLPGNNMIDRFDWRMLLSSITPNGLALQAKMLAGRALADL